jgi:hypothetical protein
MIIILSGPPEGGYIFPRLREAPPGFAGNCYEEGFYSTVK